MLLCSPRFKEMWKQKQIQYSQALEKCIENNQNAKKMAIKKKKYWAELMKQQRS